LTVTDFPTDQDSVLVVNDDVAMTEALCRLFRRLGRPVLAVPTRSSALDTMRRTRVKLLVADVDMPGLDALDFFDRARELCPHSAVIALGSWRDKARRCRLSNGSTVFSLNKPLKKEELLAVARKAIGEPSRS
jgi:two-component system C4-dicarboxylate transport response regulator DctD